MTRPQNRRSRLFKDQTYYLLVFAGFLITMVVTFQNCAVQQSSALQQLNAQGLTSFQGSQDCLPYFSANSGGYVFGVDPLSAGGMPTTTPASYATANDACLIKKTAQATAVDDILVCVQGSSQHDAVMEVVYGIKNPSPNTTVPATASWIFPSTDATKNGAGQVFVPPSSTTLNAKGVSFWELDSDSVSNTTILAVTGASIAGTTNGARCYITYPAVNGAAAVISQTQQSTDLAILERAVSVYLQTLN